MDKAGAPQRFKFNTTPRTAIKTALLACLVLAGMACGGRLNPAPYSTMAPRVPTVLGPGDTLDVRFPNNPELDVIAAVVRPDGKVTMPVVDDVDVYGLTPEELDAKLTALYKNDLANPVLSVTVAAVVSQRIYVTGEVQNPGVLPMTDRMTALEAVAAAGGFLRETAKPKSVVLLRQVNGKRQAMRLNLSSPLDSPESGMVYLAPLDIVYVPQTGIAKANRFVRQWITNMIPGLGGAGYFVRP